jgi:hypothetical protein
MQRNLLKIMLASQVLISQQVSWTHSWLSELICVIFLYFDFLGFDILLMACNMTTSSCTSLMKKWVHYNKLEKYT